MCKTRRSLNGISLLSCWNSIRQSLVKVLVVYNCSRGVTYKLSGLASSMDDQISHISDQICSEAKVKEHIADVEQHLPCIHRMQVPIANSSQSSDGPVDGSSITNPQAPIMEIRHGFPNPCVVWIMVMSSKQIIEATSSMNYEQSHLQINFNNNLIHLQKQTKLAFIYFFIINLHISALHT